MQVFVPFLSLKESACCLDNKRLGNGIYREAFTLIKGGWPNHPASKIWANHKKALSEYCLYGLEELKRRGRDYPKWFDYFNERLDKSPDTGYPSLIGNKDFHLSHMSNLIKKDPIYYRQKFGFDIPDNLPYIWKI